MTNFVFYVNPGLTLICVPHSELSAYSLEATAQLTGVHPEMLRHYCRLGLLGVQPDDRDPIFNQDGLAAIRRIEHYRHVDGVNLAALPLVCELVKRVKRLELELSLRATLR